jgi:DNA repair protein RecO (recombination protein O)
MLQNTNGIVLRSIKYGETSLITNIFTEHFGVETYLVQGVRSSKARNRAALLQPATLLSIVAYHQPQKNLQRLREFQSAYLYTSLQEEVVKNSIALFSVELLLKLLPEHAPMPELYDFGFDYFRTLDVLPVQEVANFPLFFIVQCSRLLGYDLTGEYSERTPHLNLHEGGFSENPPLVRPYVQDEDARALAKIVDVEGLNGLKEVEMNAAQRFRLLDWYLEFLHQHTQHLGQIKSLAVLQAILH